MNTYTLSINVTDDYQIRKNTKMIEDFCKEKFEKHVKIINLRNRNMFNDIIKKSVLLEIESIRFVGLKKANKNTKANLFLTKDKVYYTLFNQNPTNKWNEYLKVFAGIYFLNGYNDGGTKLSETPVKIFEDTTQIKKKDILKIGDIYSLIRIEIRLK